MKKALLIIALMLGSVAASSAQNLDKNEAKQLKAFLSGTLPRRDQRLGAQGFQYQFIRFNRRCHRRERPCDSHRMEGQETQRRSRPFRF